MCLMRSFARITLVATDNDPDSFHAFTCMFVLQFIILPHICVTYYFVACLEYI